jgi:hypothetical protein
MSQFDNGHWTYERQMKPEKYQGFVYLILNKETQRAYIGKKKYFSVLTLPPLKGMKRKRKQFKEMNWKDYSGSSADLNADIETMGKDKFEFIVLCECTTQAELTYTETKLQYDMNVLTSVLPDGSRKFYNKAIGAIKFLPPLEVAQSTREKLRAKAYNLPREKCEHCGYVCDVANLTRWHKDNCRDKPSEESND